jgi:outer membrane lipoprotein-sorting protein
MNTNLRRLGSRAGGRGLFFLLVLLVFVGSLSAQDPKAWVAAAEASQVRYNAYATLRISSVRPTYTRVMEVRAWNFSNTHALAEVLSPAQDKGTAYLRADKKMWSYLPKAKQVVQLPASMLMQGWMGSDLQLDQILGEASFSKDYTLSLAEATTTTNNRKCRVIAAVPKPGLPVVWSKVLLHLAVDKPDVVRVEYLDRRGKLAQTLDVLTYKTWDGVRMPSEIRFQPSGKKQHTRMEVLAWERRPGLTPGFFTVDKLKALPAK